jgi:hypothetical protein
MHPHATGFLPKAVWLSTAIAWIDEECAHDRLHDLSFASPSGWLIEYREQKTAN